jgi:hypothetical protein
MCLIKLLHVLSFESNTTATPTSTRKYEDTFVSTVMEMQVYMNIGGGFLTAKYHIGSITGSISVNITVSSSDYTAVV